MGGGGVKMPDNVVGLPFGHYPIAQCACGVDTYRLYVDKPGIEFERLIGIECAECGESIIFHVLTEVPQRK